MLILAGLILALMASQEAQGVRAGVMVPSEGGFVLVVDGPDVSAGSAATVVKTDRPQEAWVASVGRRLPYSDSPAKHALSGQVYELTVEGSRPSPGPAVVVLGSANAKRVGDAVLLDLGGAATSVQVRSCASREGLHLTLWAGAPLQSRRLWHAYYYLGYDVAPNCTAADYGEGG